MQAHRKPERSQFKNKSTNYGTIPHPTTSNRGLPRVSFAHQVKSKEPSMVYFNEHLERKYDNCAGMINKNDTSNPETIFDAVEKLPSHTHTPIIPPHDIYTYTNFQTTIANNRRTPVTHHDNLTIDTPP